MKQKSWEWTKTTPIERIYWNKVIIDHCWPGIHCFFHLIVWMNSIITWFQLPNVHHEPNSSPLIESYLLHQINEIISLLYLDYFLLYFHLICFHWFEFILIVLTISNHYIWIYNLWLCIVLFFKTVYSHWTIFHRTYTHWHWMDWLMLNVCEQTNQKLLSMMKIYAKRKSIHKTKRNEKMHTKFNRYNNKNNRRIWSDIERLIDWMWRWFPDQHSTRSHKKW